MINCFIFLNAGDCPTCPEARNQRSPCLVRCAKKRLHGVEGHQFPIRVTLMLVEEEVAGEVEVEVAGEVRAV